MQNGSSAPPTGREILDADALGRTLARLAHELIERNAGVDSLALVGIHTRGVPLARRLQGLVSLIPGLYSTGYDVGGSSFGTGSSPGARTFGRAGGNGLDAPEL